MSPAAAWLIAAVVLLIVEVFTTTFFILWIAIGAFVAGLFALFTKPWVPWLVFAAVTPALLWFTRPLSRRLREHSPAKTNVDAMIGEIAQVVETIDPVANTGRVRVFSDEWRARADQVIEAGSRVRITGVSGATLRVVPLPPEEQA
jgi:membrane protein implicated in regulation of membrane protease activity